MVHYPYLKTAEEPAEEAERRAVWPQTRTAEHSACSPCKSRTVLGTRSHAPLDDRK